MGANYKALIEAIEQSGESEMVFTQNSANELGCNLPKSMFTSNYIRNGANDLLRHVRKHGYTLEVGERTVKIKEPVLILHKK